VAASQLYIYNLHDRNQCQRTRILYNKSTNIAKGIARFAQSIKRISSVCIDKQRRMYSYEEEAGCITQTYYEVSSYARFTCC